MENLLVLRGRILYLGSHRVIREGDDKCVEIRRRKGKEELHPALKWVEYHKRPRGPAITISGCALFANLEPACRLRNDSRGENQNSASLRGAAPSSTNGPRDWSRPSFMSAGPDSRLPWYVETVMGMYGLEVLDSSLSSHGTARDDRGAMLLCEHLPGGAQGVGRSVIQEIRGIYGIPRSRFLAFLGIRCKSREKGMLFLTYLRTLG